MLLFATILSIASTLVLSNPPRDQQAGISPFAGSWSADLSQSKLDPKLPLNGVDITIGVDGNAVTLANLLVLANGKTIQERETFRADGTETAATSMPGIVHFANWVGPHVFAIVARKGTENLALITYQVSSDGQSLTARTSGPVDQVIVLKRRKS